MRILILGGNGFIGKNLIDKLSNNTECSIFFPTREHVDILKYEDISCYIKDIHPDIIFNLASHGGSLHYVSEYAGDVYYDNVLMALNIYRSVKTFCADSKIIQPFSNCSYPGMSSIQKEDEWLSGAVHPSIFSFANAKRAIYYLSQCYYNQYNIKTVNMLFANTYGPGDSDDPNKTHALNGMIIRMLQAKKNNEKEFVVWGTGQPIREWTYVDDFIEALILAMDIDHMEYPMNISQRKGHSIAESASTIKEVCGFEGDIIFDTSYTDGDPIKIMDDELFNKHFPDFTFYDHKKGIENTVSYYKSRQ